MLPPIVNRKIGEHPLVALGEAGLLGQRGTRQRRTGSRPTGRECGSILTYAVGLNVQRHPQLSDSAKLRIREQHAVLCISIHDAS